MSENVAAYCAIAISIRKKVQVSLFSDSFLQCGNVGENQIDAL